MKRFISNLVVILVFVLVSGTGVGAAFNHPCSMLNQEEINAIKTKLGQEPWKSAYSKMMSMANSWLTKGTLNVLAGKTPPSGDKHEFWNEGGYSGGDRTDYLNAHKVKEAVQTLGLAYALTGDSKYAEKALKFIYDWCLNPTTYMRPDKLEGGQPHLDVTITLPGMYYGADLIWNYPGWKAADKVAFQNWVKTLQQKFFNPAPTSTRVGNNWQDWEHSMMAFSAVIYEDATILNNAFTLVKYVIPLKMNSEGRMEKEYTRAGNGGISYSLYSIGPMLQVAEIARHHGVDIYNYKPGGKSLELACDFMAPYCTNPSTWPWKLGPWKPTGGDGTGVFEYINSYKQKSTYQAFLNKTRPIFDFRVSGHMTLTHGAGAYTWQIWTPGNTVDPTTAVTPIISPNGGTYTGSVTITITTSTAGATIYYTDNGTNPDESSTIYNQPFIITGSKTIKAIAYKAGLNPSSVDSADFTIETDIQPPDISSVPDTNNANLVIVHFNEPITIASAENISNYSIDNNTNVTAASLDMDHKSVTLTTSTLSPAITYTLTVNNIEDFWGNVIATNAAATFQYVDGQTSDDTWRTFTVSTQTGTFTATFDAVPNDNNIDAVTGIINGTASDYSDLACIVRFNASGQIDARDGDSYTSTNTVNYSLGTSYHFHLEIDIPSHTYSVYVTPQGQSEIILASHFAFRKEQASISQLTGWSVYAYPGSHTIDNMTFSTDVSETEAPGTPTSQSGSGCFLGSICYPTIAND